MSGSDPSVRTTAGLGPAGDGGCPQSFETVLGSPNPTVVASLTIGELLDVTSVTAPIRGVLAFRRTGDMVGAIARDIARLIRCLDEGIEYEAEVLRIVGGAVTVMLRQR